MNKKNIMAVLLSLLLAAAFILGLPVMTRHIERQMESGMPIVTATPLPNYDH